MPGVAGSRIQLSFGDGRTTVVGIVTPEGRVKPDDPNGMSGFDGNARGNEVEFTAHAAPPSGEAIDDCGSNLPDELRTLLALAGDHSGRFEDSLVLAT